MPDSNLIDYNATAEVTRAIETRRSLRAFLPRMPEQSTIRDMLATAARAPSGTNTQPWRVYVLTGNTRDTLCEAVCNAFDARDTSHQIEVPYYPEKWFEPYISRRRKVGWDLYGLLDITKGDREKTHAQHRRNFVFFDAPVGLIFTLHRDMSIGSWLDYGMFLQNIMVLARGQGMHTCPQAAWNDYHSIIRDVLSIDENEIVVCGMALGYADESAIENSLLTERATVDEFATFLA